MSFAGMRSSLRSAARQSGARFQSTQVRLPAQRLPFESLSAHAGWSPSLRTRRAAVKEAQATSTRLHPPIHQRTALPPRYICLEQAADLRIQSPGFAFRLVAQGCQRHGCHLRRRVGRNFCVVHFALRQPFPPGGQGRECRRPRTSPSFLPLVVQWTFRDL